jgi:threonine/homoserine/homoserine lactone efflux protein
LEFLLFTKGFLIGLTMAAPVGPVGILSLKRTFMKGHLYGLVSGLGISTADAIYGLLALFSLTTISDFILAHQLWLRILGGIILCGLGIKTFFKSVHDQLAYLSGISNYVGAYLSALFLTLLNPILILAFGAIFAGMGLVSQSTSYLASVAIVSGLFLGSASWWVFLSGMLSSLRMRFNDALIQKINQFSGVLIVFFGVIIIGSAIFM